MTYARNFPIHPVYRSSLADANDAAHHAAWAAHVAAGRIGTPTVLTPGQRAVLDHNDALFRARAVRHRAAVRSGEVR